ncbi:MAG: hypothetical protein HW403_606 [Dehalococcoidia bacterium]|nr:hypothetical protein [Dehalococcoidia bacterium]
MEIRGHLEEIKVAIEEPDVIVVDDTGCYRYYKLGAIGGRFRGLYLQVLVRYSEEPQGKVGIIVSAFCSRVIAQGELRWIRGITR